MNNISNEIYIDLYSQSSRSKKIFRIVIGISYLLVAVLKLTGEWGEFTTFDYVYMFSFLVVGLIYFFSGMGIRSINLINSYLLIDEEKVIFKKDLFDKEVFYFKNIEQVKINYLSADFVYKDATYKKLELGMLNTENLSLVKQRLEKLS